MEDKGKDIEDLFRERFASAEAPVSPKVWQNIKSTLPPPPVAGILGLGALKGMVLWSASALISVSIAVGSYLYLTKDTTKTSTPIAVQNQILSSTDRVNTLFIDSTENKSAHQANTNFSLDSLTKNLDSKIEDEKFVASNSIPATKENSYSIATENNSHSLKKREGKKENVDKGNLSFTNNKYTSTTERASQKNKNQQVTDLSSNTQKNYSTNSISEQSLKTSPSVKKEKVMTHSTNKNNAAIETDNNILTENKKNESAKNVVTNSDNLNYKSDTTISLLSGNSTNPRVKNSTSSDSIKPVSFSDQVSLTTKDSSLSTIDSSLITTSIETYHHSVDQTQKEAQASTTTNIEQDSIVSFSDSLSHATASIAAPDSASVLLDSMANTTKDSVLAETSNKKEKKESPLLKRFSFDFVATALSTGAVTKATDTLYQSAVEEKNKNDKNSLGYSIGIIANYKWSEKLSVSLGVAYSTFSEEYVFSKENSNVYDSSFVPYSIKVKDKYDFISIPLQVSYTFLSKGNLKLSAIAGIRSNILMKGITHLRNQAQTGVTEIKSGFNSISFMYQVSLEAAYTLNKHTTLLLQPTFLYGASSIHSKASALSQKPYGMGVTVGLRFTF